MGVAVRDSFLSSRKEHALFRLKEEEMLGGIAAVTKVCGETAGHRDGVQSRWNKPTALCVHMYIEILFSFAIPVTKQ